MLLLLLVSTGCGLPGTGDVRTVEDESVPYRLLEDEAPSGPQAPEGSFREGVPLVFWVAGGERLAPATTGASCEDGVAEVVEVLLDALADGPEEGARSAGRSTAVPPASSLRLVELADGVATVSLDSATLVSADRLPLAVGQVVLTVTSAPSVRQVRLRVDGEQVQVPLPGGALTPRAVSGDDYAALLPERYRTSGGGGVSTAVGCPDARS